MEVSGQRHTQPLYPLRKTLSTHCIGNLVGTSVGLDVSEKIKVSFLQRDQKSERYRLQFSDNNDPPDWSGWDGVYFSGEISGCTSILREASSARLASVLRMTVKHARYNESLFFYQLDTQIPYLIHLLHSSICFEHYCFHLQ